MNKTVFKKIFKLLLIVIPHLFPVAAFRELPKLFYCAILNGQFSLKILLHETEIAYWWYLWLCIRRGTIMSSDQRCFKLNGLKSPNFSQKPSGNGTGRFWERHRVH